MKQGTTSDVVIKGFLEFCDPLQVRGWVFVPEHPLELVEVEVLCDGRMIGRVLANVYRQDLEAGSIGQGDHAFIFNFPAPLTAGELDRVTVRAVLTQDETVDLPRLRPASPAAASASAPRVAALNFPEIARDETQHPVFILGSARSGTSAMIGGLIRVTRYTGHEEGHFLGVLAPLLVHLQRYYGSKFDEFVTRSNTMIAQVPQQFMCDAIYHGLIVAMRTLYPDGCWAEKTPNHDMIHLAPRFREIWPNARFIFMRRRAIENIASRLRKFDYNFAENCKEWASAMTAWVGVRDELKGAALEVDQSFMAEHPDEAASAVARLLALDERESNRLAQVLNAERPQRTSATFAEVLSLDAMHWPPENVAVFDEVCGGMMRRFGYSTTADYAEAGGSWSGLRFI
jgi:hypothetical protein